MEKAFVDISMGQEPAVLPRNDSNTESKGSGIRKQPDTDRFFIRDEENKGEEQQHFFRKRQDLLHRKRYLFPKEPDTEIYNCYPIYDWRTEDIWRANGKRGWDYNHIYDIMHMAGVSIYKQRLCQPYGDDQRQGLYLFKILEPETWAKVVNRVEGANFGNRYTETDRTTLGNFKVNLPEGHTYESYAKFLLQTMPPYLAEHYQQKIDRFLAWWEKEGVSSIPDYADIKDEARRKVPSWRRICKVLLKNDYWCKGLSFSQTKKELEKQVAMITRYNEEL